MPWTWHRELATEISACLKCLERQDGNDLLQTPRAVFKTWSRVQTLPKFAGRLEQAGGIDVLRNGPKVNQGSGAGLGGVLVFTEVQIEICFLLLADLQGRGGRKAKDRINVCWGESG